MVDELVISGIRLRLTTLLPRHGRNVGDRGSLSLLALAALKKGDRLLVLGDGGGVLALVAAKIIGETNVVVAGCTPETANWIRENAGLNGLGGLTVVEGRGFAGLRGQSFSVIIARPSFRLDFPTARRLIHGAPRHLLLGGRCLFLVQRRLWYARRIRAVFGQVRSIR
ncbi:MAG: methyltransferase, partial [Firmicutes bacterium]|nr:methyltransferase [Bacillota bacterium]